MVSDIFHDQIRVTHVGVENILILREIEHFKILTKRDEIIKMLINHS